MNKLDESKDSKLMGWFKSHMTVQAVVANAFIACLYAVVTMLCAPLSYSFSQFRFSEMLNLLVFFNPSYTIGLTIGCLLANLMSVAGVFDILFGTLATLISCILMVLLSKFVKNLFLNSLIPSLINAIIVPFVLFLAGIGVDGVDNTVVAYWVMFGFVFLGEFVCITCIGYPLFLILTKKSKGFYNLILANRNLDYKW